MVMLVLLPELQLPLLELRPEASVGVFQTRRGSFLRGLAAAQAAGRFAGVLWRVTMCCTGPSSYPVTALLIALCRQSQFEQPHHTERH